MKTIVITGAGSGLGRELAIQYGKQNNFILLVGRNREKLESVQAEIGENSAVFTCDIRNFEEVEQLATTIQHTYKVDFLLNNAGIGIFGDLTSLSYEDINTMLDTNVKGTIYMTKAFLPHLLTRDHAKIMNIISTAGLRGKLNEQVYCASKFAVRGFTEGLIHELENTSVSVTAVYMGGMATPFWEGSTHIKNPARLRSAQEVAKKIIEQDNGEKEIIID